MAKNYSVNRDRRGRVIYEVDGALYASLAQVPDEADRAVLAGMDDGSPERESAEDPGTVMDSGADAAVTARTRMIFLLAFSSIAAVMLLVAGITSYDAFIRSGTDLQAPGVVVDTVEEPGDEGTIYSYPVVAFTDQDGLNHTVKIREGSSPPAWAAGDAVTVLYDPGNPADARTGSWTGTLLLWLVPLVAGIVGIGFLLAVVLVLMVMPAESR
jgi:hypothetical protein